MTLRWLCPRKGCCWVGYSCVVVVVVVLVVSSSCCCISCSGCGSGWSTLALVPPYVTAAALMKVAECLMATMARSRPSTAPHGGNTGTSSGLKVRSAVVVHLAQEKKKSCWKSCWNWSLGPAGEPEEEWEQRPGQPVHGDCMTTTNAEHS